MKWLSALVSRRKAHPCLTRHLKMSVSVELGLEHSGLFPESFLGFTLLQAILSPLEYSSAPQLCERRGSGHRKGGWLRASQGRSGWVTPSQP